MILNRASDGLLSVLLVLRRTLIAYGPMRRERLVSLCAPVSAVTKPPNQPHDKKVADTLNRWTQLGFFVESGSKIELASALATVGVDDQESVRTALLELVLRAENNPRGDESEEATSEIPGASDFTNVAAWTLQQDPYTFGQVEDYVEFERTQGVSPPVLRNETRWAGFRDWAHFLGISVPFGSRQTVLLMNPARALRGVLPKVVPGERTRIDAVMSAIAEHLPVLDGGRYWRETEARTQKPWRRFAPTEVSPSLSLAFRQLRHEGLIRLEDLSDAPTRLALLGRGGRTLESVTHVTRETT